MLLRSSEASLSCFKTKCMNISFTPSSSTICVLNFTSNLILKLHLPPNCSYKVVISSCSSSCSPSMCISNCFKYSQETIYFHACLHQRARTSWSYKKRGALLYAEQSANGKKSHNPALTTISEPLSTAKKCARFKINPFSHHISPKVYLKLFSALICPLSEHTMFLCHQNNNLRQKVSVFHCQGFTLSHQI